MKKEVNIYQLFALPFILPSTTIISRECASFVRRMTLHKYASLGQWSTTLQLLSESSKDINALCPLQSATLSMKAAACGSLTILDHLVHFGADLSIADPAGLTVFDYAVKHAEVFTIAKVISWLKGNTDHVFKDPMFYQSSLAAWTVSTGPSS